MGNDTTAPWRGAPRPRGGSPTVAEEVSGALRQEGDRPSHLCHRRRRLPDGGHQPRGDRPCGNAALGKLIVLWDDNNISIDGAGLAVGHHRPAHALQGGRLAGAVLRRARPRGTSDSAIERAKSSKKPTLIACKTHIGFGAPTQAGHGEGAWVAAGRRGNLQVREIYELAPRPLRHPFGHQRLVGGRRRAGCRCEGRMADAVRQYAGIAQARDRPGLPLARPRRSSPPPPLLFSPPGTVRAFKKEASESMPKVATRKASRKRAGRGSTR